jgi:immunity protein 5 of polymorphic toxin system
MSAIELSLSELREVTRYAVACATPALRVFEAARPGDPRPREALDAAQAFADGGARTRAIRDCAWAAHRAYQETRDAGQTAASEAARAAVAAAGAAFLHPLAKATQVLHILGPAGHAARALELEAGDDHKVGADFLAWAEAQAGTQTGAGTGTQTGAGTGTQTEARPGAQAEARPGARPEARPRVLTGGTVVDVLTRYPAAPDGRGRVGELVRALNARLRGPVGQRNADETEGSSAGRGMLG